MAFLLELVLSQLFSRISGCEIKWTDMLLLLLDCVSVKVGILHFVRLKEKVEGPEVRDRYEFRYDISLDFKMALRCTLCKMYGLCIAYYEVSLCLSNTYLSRQCRRI